MEITLQRTLEFDDPTLGKSTIGLLCIDGVEVATTLEDGFHPLYEKVKGETRIPAGRYPVKKRQVLSPLTQKYRKKSQLKGIFDYHLEIQDVPFFENVYIHIGNYPTNTDGCVLVGEKHVPGKSMISNSTQTFIKVYRLISAALESGEEVFIEIS